MAAQIANLAEGIKKNLKGISSAFLKVEFANEQNAVEAPIVEGVAEKAIKEALPAKTQAGLLVTGALDKALEECKQKVDAIAQRCRMTNRKFRDIEFDLEKNQFYCRYGLGGSTDGFWKPVAVKRVTDIFEKPVFFGPDGPKASDVRQGALGDCWFLAALSAISTVDDLVQKICVARNEEVGVYGFVFFRDGVWKTVIVDDFLLWSMPKYDELNPGEQKLYHNERETYHQVVEKSGKGLLYARSGVVGETWVPLIEKAYAKLHGDYAALEGGFLSEGIEDLTGAVATCFQMSDLLSTDRFWMDELQHADNQSRLFGVALYLDEARSQVAAPNVQGLWPAHAYSVLRAKECKGKRFVVVRNPWGNSEWTGAWADGSKEWKGEWLDVLSELGHEFGDDGQFVMEYSDFLSVFQMIDRATLFDSNWVMSSYWLRVPPQPTLHPWTYGDVYYFIKLDKASAATIVLAQSDHRYYKSLHGSQPQWWLDFVVYKRDTRELVGISGISLGSLRSVSCEVNLEAGEYIVLPRVEPVERGDVEYADDTWDRAKLSRVLAERAESRLLAVNYEVWQEIKNIPQGPEVALEVELKRVEPPKPDDKDKEAPPVEAGSKSDEKTDTTTSSSITESKPETKPDEAATEKKEESAQPQTTQPEGTAPSSEPKEGEGEKSAPAEPKSNQAEDKKDPAKPNDGGEGENATTDAKPTETTGVSKPELTVTLVEPPIGGSPPMTAVSGMPFTPWNTTGGKMGQNMPLQVSDAWNEGPPTQPLFLGLRVYTRDGAVAIVTGRLKDA